MATASSSDAADEEWPLGGRSSPSMEGQLAQPQPTKCILAADCEPYMALLVSRILTRAGYHALVAANGADTLATARREQIDLIVLDLWMPDLDGFNLLSQLVELHGPRILVFTDGRRGWEERALALGAAGFVEKPASPSRLLEAVQRALAD